MKFLAKKQKGFTLIELMVSIFIFTIIMSIVVEIFGKQVVTARNARVLQRNIEEASTAMNYLAKTLRTSTLPTTESVEAIEKGNLKQSPETDYVKIIYAYDFSQRLCFKFAFEGKPGQGKLMMYTSDKVTEEAGTGDRTYLCAMESTYSGVADRKLTKGNVTGAFYISPTREDIEETGDDPEVYDESLGKVTISLEIDNRNTEQVKQGDEGIQNMVIIQTSVSLRDYPSDITF